MKFYTLLLIVLLVSCNSTTDVDRLSIGGYMLGDTIDQGIDVISEVSMRYSRGEIILNPNVKVRIYNNHIDGFYIDSISPIDAKSLKDRISRIYRIAPEYDRDSIPYRTKWADETYVWFDTISKDRIRLVRELLNNPDSISFLEYRNIDYSISYKEEIEGPSEYDFTPMLR